MRPSDKKPCPRVVEYLSQVPRGIDAHPDCQIKGSAVRQFGDAVLSSLSLDGWALPPPVELLFRNPPAHSQWVPEVHFSAYLLAIADMCGMSDERFLEWTAALDRAMFDKLVFKVLVAFASLDFLTQQGANRWAVVHRGTELTRVASTDLSVEWRLDFPERLWSPLLLTSHSKTFEAILLLSGAKAPRVQVGDGGSRSARYLATWNR